MNLKSIYKNPITNMGYNNIGFCGNTRQTCAPKKPSRMTLSDDDENLTVKNGIVYTDDGEKFYGTYSFIDKNGKTVVLSYKSGQLDSVTKDNKQAKWYVRYKDNKDKNGNITNGFDSLGKAPRETQTLGYQNFTDGSRIPASELYGYDGAGCTIVYDCEARTTTTTVSNPNAKHEGEPVIEVNKYHWGKTTPINTFMKRKESGLKVKIFQNLDEAHKYFENEYGIKAKFDTLGQAHIAKAAVDDFVELLGDKKCLKGLNFATEDLSKGTNSSFSTYPYPMYKNKDTAIKFIKAYNNGEIRDFLSRYKPDKLKVQFPSIQFNKNVDYDNISEIMLEDGLSRFHPAYTIKGCIHHEIGHYLHCIKDPINYYSLKNHSYEGYNLAYKVSEYAQENIKEFVAEYIEGKMAGKTYSKEVDDYYLECGGPDIFNKKG